ncbi:two-component system, sensor histidine kinase and response regulator [Rhodocyclaceae bacterium]|nr:two-component system, sensor histidine kinase and response regulator [Rhodocyclaceae bacterium]
MPAATIASIKRYLYLLAAVVVASLAGMLAYTLHSDTQNAVAQERVRLRTLATIIAANTTQLLEQNRDAMERIAQRPLIRAMDPARCDPILADFHALFPQFANLATIDPTGLAPCSGVPQPGGKPVSVAKAEWFKRGIEEQRFLAGNTFRGPITGKMVSVLVQPVRDDAGGFRGLLGLPLDIERFDPHVPTETLPQGTRFGILSGSGFLVWRNVDPEGLIGKYVGDQAGPRRSLEIGSGEFESPGTDGVARYYAVVPIPGAGWYAYAGVTSSSISAGALRSALGNSLVGLAGLLLAGILLFVLIRRIEQTEADLLEAKEAAEAASRAKSLFLSNMSHELRTPLNAILGFAELLERDRDLPEHERHNVRTINRSGHHLLSLINDILEISRIEAGRLSLSPQACDLPELIATLVESMELRARNDGLALRLEMAPDLPHYVTVDIGKLRQIILNLLSNAIKYTPHGEVVVEARAVAAGAGLQLVFTVRDTGVGIAAEDLERIFRPFFQTDRGIQVGEGTGLGLTIARQYAELLGGTLTAKSVVERGSAFTLTLPLEPAAADMASAAAPRRRVVGLAPGQPVRRILIAEDKPDNYRLLSQLMTSVGFAVEVAVNGREAVERFRQWRPDFIWMDMRMPELDGYAATREIRALPGGADLPIVALTASAFEEDRAAILAAGCSDMVRKPLQVDRIFEVLAARLGVEFVYDETAPDAPTEAPAADLATLPAPLRRRLHEAALALDAAAVQAIAAEVEAEQPGIAATIRRLAAEYRYQDLLAPGDEPNQAQP